MRRKQGLFFRAGLVGLALLFGCGPTYAAGTDTPKPPLDGALTKAQQTELDLLRALLGYRLKSLSAEATPFQRAQVCAAQLGLCVKLAEYGQVTECLAGLKKYPAMRKGCPADAASFRRACETCVDALKQKWEFRLFVQRFWELCKAEPLSASEALRWGWLLKKSYYATKDARFKKAALECYRRGRESAKENSRLWKRCDHEFKKLEPN